MAIINGYSYSRVRIEGTHEVTVDLPLTNFNGGLVESYETIKVKQDLIGLNINSPTMRKAQDIHGFFIYFNFSFSDFATGETMMKFKTIIESAKVGDSIYLTPRIDEDWRFFKVLWNDDNFDLALRRGGANAKYHKGFNISFVTEEIQTSLNWGIAVPPDTRLYAIGDSGFEQVLYQT